jgi:UDP-N-acetyl-D-galactosamine dehydrogenase
MVGYHPQIILAGRRINDGMGEYIADKTVKLMARSGRSSTGASVNVLGITFKENLADLRNSRVPDIVRELQSLGVEAHVHDPIADRSEAMSEYGIELRSWDELRPSDALIIAVAHRQFASLSPKSIASKLKPNAWLVDVKACLDARAVRAGGLNLWQL